eukprot:c23688_g1_i2 orf=247-558(-)
MAQGLRMVGNRVRSWAANPLPSPAWSSTLALGRRGISIAPGERERALLEEDPALKHYKSSKDTARRVKRIGDVLVIIVSAGCIYQIYGVTQKRRAERLGQSKS